eukprot:4605608-Prymnesium_polylepis.1
MRREKWARAPGGGGGIGGDGSASGAEGTEQLGLCDGTALRGRIECLYLPSEPVVGMRKDDKPKSVREQCVDGLRQLAYECVEDEVEMALVEELRSERCASANAVACGGVANAVALLVDDPTRQAVLAEFLRPENAPFLPEEALASVITISSPTGTLLRALAELLSPTVWPA